MQTCKSTVTGSNGYTFINWSNKPYPDNRVYDKNITNNLDDVNYIVNKNTAYKPYKDTTLYAHWYRDLQLTFNLNGGKYNGSTSNITLKGTIYDYEPHFTFNITSGLTAQSKGHYDKQINSIDAYGTYSTTDGTNTKYTKVDSEGTVYRFTGWSTNKNAKVPDESFSVYNSARSNTYSISENTTLYAVWEKVLEADINWKRPLGNYNFPDGTAPALKLTDLDPTSSEDYRIQLCIRPSEMVQYIVKSPCEMMQLKVTFDTRITDIYNYGDSKSTWFDELNPSTSEDQAENQKHGLNRHITNNKNIDRRFHIPLYLGTEWSYDTSNPNKASNTNYYTVDFYIFQESYFYKMVYNTLEEIHVTGEIYLIQAESDNPAPDPPKPPEIDQIFSEFKTVIR